MKLHNLLRQKVFLNLLKFGLSLLVFLNMEHFTQNDKGVKISEFNSKFYADLMYNSIKKEKNKLILSRDRIKYLNKKAEKKGLITSPLSMGKVISGYTIKKLIRLDLNYVKVSAKYDYNNIFIPRSRRLRGFYRNVNMSGLKKKVIIKYGVIIKDAFLRVVPSYEYRMAEKDDYYFDVLQASFVQLGDVVAILHKSRDGAWYYVQTKYARGWLSKKHISVVSVNRIKSYLKHNKLIVIDNKCKTYFSDGRFYDYIYMGHHLYYKFKRNGKYYIDLPYGKNDYIRLYVKNNEGISERYLKFTKYNFFKQSMKMIDQPYGWGGYNGSVDCSGLFTRLFRCFGLDLPKGSKAQMSLFKNERIKGNKLRKIKEMKPFRTFLYKKGHIMLYVGTYLGKPLIFHAPWKYFSPTSIKMVIGKVVISDLELGKGSKEGSLLEQIYKAGTL